MRECVYALNHYNGKMNAYVQFIIQTTFKYGKEKQYNQHFYIGCYIQFTM